MPFSAVTGETIAAIATAPGRGGIGIVRLSGPEAFAVAGTLLHGQAPLEHARARLTAVRDPDAPDGPPLDEALVTAFHAPRSYTGDDLVEIAAHGAPVVLDAILRGALRGGARLAEPGEFTQRAFLSGRLDLLQAEAVHDLVAAHTLEQARAAAQQLGGALSRRIAPVKEDLLHLIALLEAGMDFASGELDDVDVVPPAQIADTLAGCRTALTGLASSFATGALLRSGARVALVGPPNAGKSSLFNRLLQRERAIVTAIPGTTRDTVEETWSLSGIPIHLIDTAGLRAMPEGSTDPVEQIGMERTRETMADADLVLAVHDATLPLTEEEADLLRALTGRPHLLIRNKADLPHSTTDSQALAAPIVDVSALQGTGLDELQGQMLQLLNAHGRLAQTGALNNRRQHEAVLAALAAVEIGAEANHAGLPHEMLLVDLHHALQSLDTLTGQTTADDILGRIFSTFCIGK